MGARSGTLGFVASGTPDFNVQGRQSQFFAPRGHVLGGQHGGVRRGFVAIGLDLHAARDADEGFPSREIRHVDKGIIERGKEMGDAKDFFAVQEANSAHGLYGGAIGGGFGCCFTVVMLGKRGESGEVSYCCRLLLSTDQCIYSCIYACVYLIHCSIDAMYLRHGELTILGIY